MQLRLFDEPLRGHGHVRVVSGNMAETMTAAFTGGTRISTDSRADYCPDVVAEIEGRKVFIECKAVGLSNETFVYHGRLEKDRLFAAEHSLMYAIWRHRAATKKCSTVQQLQAAWLTSLEAAYLVPFKDFFDIAIGSGIEKLNSAYGSSRTQPKMYGSGYRVRLAKLAAWKVLEFANNSRKPRTAY